MAATSNVQFSNLLHRIVTWAVTVKFLLDDGKSTLVQAMSWAAIQYKDVILPV